MDTIKLFQINEFNFNTSIKTCFTILIAASFVLLYKKRSRFAWHINLLILPIVPLFFLQQFLKSPGSNMLDWPNTLIFTIWIIYILWLFKIRNKYFEYIKSINIETSNQSLERDA